MRKLLQATIFTLTAQLLVCTCGFAEIVVLSDSFNDSSQYSTSEPAFSDGGMAYFGRVVLPNTSVPLPSGAIKIANGPPTPNVAYESFGTGAFVGGNFFGAQDTGDEQTSVWIEWNDLDITGLQDLTFSGLFAEDNASDGLEDWDFDSQVRVLAKVDNAQFFTQILSFASTGFDTAPSQDTNFDGIGDGTVLTDTFQSFTAGISGTGNFLDIRIEILNLNDADEDIAFDFIRVTGTAVPEPSSSIALLISGVIFTYRRNRKTAGSLRRASSASSH